MKNSIVISLNNISKCFAVYDKPYHRLMQSLYRGRKRFHKEFWALKDISFDIRQGETVGIIGRNGSGKSTLLQIICGTLAPTSGSIVTHGRIAALLELGSGFNPEFSGRDNVYMNGAVLGLSKEEIDACFDDIAAFADIGEFIEQPVKTYSSGMAVRLAFAVQSQVDPDILVVDEALAVGDVKFQTKCFDRLRQLKDQGTSILLVTHSGEQIVTHCSKAILLSQGQQLCVGEPRQLVNQYMDLLFGKEKRSLTKPLPPASSTLPITDGEYSLNYDKDVFSARPGYNPYEYRWGDRTAAILDFYIAAAGESYPSVISSGQQVTLAVSFRFHSEVPRPILGITIKTKEGVTVYGINSETLECIDFQQLGKSNTVACAVAQFICRLAAGDYFISLGLATRQGEQIIPHDRRYDVIHMQVQPNPEFFGLVNLELNLSARQLPI